MSVRMMMTVLCFSVVLIGAAAWAWTPDKTRAEIESKYLKSRSDLMLVSGHMLHVRDTGQRSAPAIIMLHGFGSSLQTWEPWATALSKAFRVVRYDFSGSGLSAPDPQGDYSDPRSLEVLAALMTSLGIEKATLIGNSLGGRIAWKFAAHHPELVNRLVLISPDGFESPGFEYGKRPHVPAVVKAMRYILPKAMLRQNLAPSYGDPTLLDASTVDRYYDLLLAPGARDAMILRMEQTVLEPPEPALQRISAPTLLLWGTRDAMIPISNADDYLRNIKGATLVKLEGLGHVPHEEAPETALRPVEEFLRQ